MGQTSGNRRYATDTDTRDYRTEYDMKGDALKHNFDELMDELVGTCPVAHSPDGDGYWILNRYEDVRDAAQNWETFSSKDGFIPNRPPGMPLAPPIEVDPPLHTDLRAVINPFLGPKAIRVHEPAIRAIANALIDSFVADGTVEVVGQYGNQLAGQVFCAVVAGMPAEDMAFLQKAFQDGLHGPIDERAAANGRAMDYIGKYMQRRSEEPPRGDVVDAILGFEAPGFEFEHKVRTLGLLTQGGIGTTGSIIAGSLFHLARHPEDRKALLDDFSLIPTAIEEFLRYYASAPQLGRKVVKDTEVAGTAIRAGEWVVLSYGAANRDPDICPMPRTVDIGRTPNRHMSFGGGPHRCAGSHLARLDLRISLETFLTRIPEFSIPEDFEPEFTAGVTRDMVRLPLRFDPAATT
jgi:cytochrome P450